MLSVILASLTLNYFAAICVVHVTYFWHEEWTLYLELLRRLRLKSIYRINEGKWESDFCSSMCIFKDHGIEKLKFPSAAFISSHGFDG